MAHIALHGVWVKRDGLEEHPGGVGCTAIRDQREAHPKGARDDPGATGTCRLDAAVISHIEAGQREPRVKNIVRIANALDAQPGDLFAGL